MNSRETNKDPTICIFLLILENPKKMILKVPIMLNIMFNLLSKQLSIQKYIKLKYIKYIIKTIIITDKPYLAIKNTVFPYFIHFSIL